MGEKAHRGARSAITGHFVKMSYAEKHPNTTVKENIPNPGYGDTGRGKGKGKGKKGKR